MCKYLHNTCLQTKINWSLPPISPLAFTLSRRSPNFTGELSPARYQQIFADSHGRYGSTHDYARQTLESLQSHSISDAALDRLLKLAQQEQAEHCQRDAARLKC